ncbi:hypothetical protein [Nocardia wallacei]|uniref:hypothetical protein n=1 Tax=Nocardia wallacei TaxID=480035 RepID=UPI0024572C25|nr:hypothetical protein [Nocardia wallacei]
MAAGFRLALTLVDAVEDAGGVTLRWLEDAAARCARLGIPIDDVHAVVAEGLRAGLGDDVGCGPAQPEPGDGDAPTWLRDTLRRTVTRAYRHA